MESASRRQKSEEAFNQARRLEGLPVRRANEELNTSWNGIQRNGDEAEDFNEKADG